MFLKRCHRIKNGKEHVYRQWVESYRTVRGSRHRVVAYLGELRGREGLRGGLPGVVFAGGGWRS